MSISAKEAYLSDGKIIGMYFKTYIQLRNSLQWKHDKAYALVANTDYL